MAIAYYIPDQAKLLAGSRASREAANNNRNSNDNSTSNPQRTSNNNAANDTTNPAMNRAYGTNINLTVPTYAATQEPSSGCWDFLTQVFCHALRFYHESSQVQPTVIQISVNFQSQGAENPIATGNSTTSGNSPTTTTATTMATTTAMAQEITTSEVNSQSGNNSNSPAMSTSANSPSAPHSKQHKRQSLKKDNKSGRRKF